MKKNKCNNCGRQNANPKSEILTIDGGESGITCLGRTVPMEPKVEYWRCRHCQEPTVIALHLQLDEDKAVLDAYEEQFGTATEAVKSILAQIITAMLGVFGEDWTTRCEGGMKQLIRTTVEDAKKEYGDEWAVILSDAKWGDWKLEVVEE